MDNPDMGMELPVLAPAQPKPAAKRQRAPPKSVYCYGTCLMLIVDALEYCTLDWLWCCDPLLAPRPPPRSDGLTQ
jgi:hypothetical protein